MRVHVEIPRRGQNWWCQSLCKERSVLEERIDIDWNRQSISHGPPAEIACPSCRGV